MSEPIHIISLGAGVQSSTMALMAARGEIGPMPTCAIFADTGDEPDDVYDYLEYLKPNLPFPVFTVSESVPLSVAMFVPGAVKGNGKTSYVSIPTHKVGSHTQRRCTKYFKIIPIHRKAREVSGGKKCVMWIGISVDEVTRAKDSRVKWMRNTFPLLDARMTRHDCLLWLQRNNFKTPPKSACIYCPYRTNAQWKELKQSKYWPRILAIDAALSVRGEFLHRKKIPINEVDFSTEEERGQINLFENECEGMCGV